MSLEKALLSNSAVFLELTDLLSSIPDSIYQRQSMLYCQKQISSIGTHCRHIIEFYQSFLKGVFSGNINYDQRARNVELEINRSSALKEIQNMEQQLTELMHNRLLKKSLYLQAQVDVENIVTIKTCLERELVFLQSHSVHHQAMIALLMHCFELPVPKGFGVATSTRIHHNKIKA